MESHIGSNQQLEDARTAVLVTTVLQTEFNVYIGDGDRVVLSVFPMFH